MILFTAPFQSQSGYGFKSREIMTALVEEYEDQLYVAPTLWGSNPNDELDKEENAHLRGLKHAQELQERPKLHIHVGIPEDFKPHGEKNILFTSGVETDRISPEWIQQLSQIPNLHIVVPSNYVKNVFEKTAYNGERDGKQFEIKLDVPITVIPESYNPDIFNEMNDDEQKMYDDILGSIGGRKFFFSSGQGIPEKILMDADRKGYHQLISAFWSMFSKDDDICLLLKLNGVDNSEITYHQFLQVFDDIKWSTSSTDQEYDNKAPIKLLKGFIPSNVLFNLMSHPNNLANIYPTKGEGFGRMILEASLSGNRLLVPKIGAFTDFTRESFTTYMDGAFRKIPMSAVMDKILIPDSMWYHIQKETIVGLMKSLHRDKEPKLNTKKIQEDISDLKDEFSIDSVKTQIKNYISKKYVKMIDLKSENNNIPKIKIPRLNKK